MDRQTLMSWIVILSGITGLLTFTLLQITVLSEHHGTRQRHYLQLLDCNRRFKGKLRAPVNTLRICDKTGTGPCEQVFQVQNWTDPKLDWSRVNGVSLNPGSAPEIAIKIRTAQPWSKVTGSYYKKNVYF